MSDSGARRHGQTVTALGQGARAAVPIVLGYLSIGFAAGVVQRSAGLSVAEVMLMSLLLYAGSAQFVVASLIVAAGPGPLPVLAVVGTVFLVNLRHMLLSAALAPYFSRIPAWKNGLLGLQLTDETFVVAWSELLRGRAPEEGRAAWMAGLNLSAYLSWAAANLAGALASGYVGDTRALGFDFALPAMFGALLMMQLSAQPGSGEQVPAPSAGGGLTPAALVVAPLAAVLAVAIALVLPGQWNIIIATLVAASAALLFRRSWKSDRKS
jgi:4-azaleucine resistance transporter AzlC